MNKKKSKRKSKSKTKSYGAKKGPRSKSKGYKQWIRIIKKGKKISGKN